MKRFFVCFLLLSCLSTLAFADIILPKFKVDKSGRHFVGYQKYPKKRNYDILFQLGFWSNNEVSKIGMNSVLTNVFDSDATPTGQVTLKDETSSPKFALYHASTGKKDAGKNAATLFFIEDGEDMRIIGVGKHREIDHCKKPQYDIFAWDERYESNHLVNSVFAL